MEPIEYLIVLAGDNMHSIPVKANNTDYKPRSELMVILITVFVAGKWYTTVRQLLKHIFSIRNYLTILFRNSIKATTFRQLKT